MNIIAIAISGALFVVGLYIGRVTNTLKTPEKIEQNPRVEQEVKGETTNTNIPLVTPSPTITPQPTDVQINSDVSLNDFVYPLADIKSKTSNTLTITSTDKAADITLWYENQLKTHNFSSRSQAKTNSNGNILNKLGGGKNGTQIMITIEKKPSEQTVYITISAFNNPSDNSIRVEIKNNSNSVIQ